MRVMHRFSIAAFAILILVSWAHADDDNDEAQRYPLLKLLDADVPLVERKAVFEYFDRQAIAGNAAAQYVIGSLYRIGERSPANTVDRDDERAKRYLSTAAAHGYVRAMAKMAEVELGDQRYLEAMIWAQLYGYYADLHALPSAEGKKPRDNGYLADLLARIYARFDQTQMQTVQDDVRAFIANHDVAVREGMAQSGMLYGSSKMQLLSSDRRHYSPPITEQKAAERRDVMADYLVEFDRTGNARRAWLLDALPDIALGKELKTIAMNARVNATDAPAEDVRYGVLPINFSWGRYHLRSSN